MALVWCHLSVHCKSDLMWRTRELDARKFRQVAAGSSDRTRDLTGRQWSTQLLMFLSSRLSPLVLVCAK